MSSKREYDLAFRVPKSLRHELDRITFPTRARSDRIAARREADQVRREEEALRSKEPEVREDAAHWTASEQSKLLRELHAHGSRRPRKLARLIKTRSEDAVRTYISKVKQKHNFYQPATAASTSSAVKTEDHGLPGGRAAAAAPGAATESKLTLVRRVRDAPIETWIDLLEGGSFSSDASAGLPVLMESVAKGERHPEGGKVDYAAIYEMLGALMAGEAPRELDGETSDKVVEMMARLLEFVCDQKNSIGQERELLEHFNLKSQGGEEWARSSGGLGALSGFNPLGLPDKMFKR